MPRPSIQLLYSVDDPSARGELSDDDLVRLYRYPGDGRRRLRTNFVSSLDGSVQGPDGRSGGLGTASDSYVFALHRALADAVVVGASTVREESYRSIDLQPWQSELRERLGLAPYPALVIISGRAQLDPVIAQPEQGEGGPVMIITTSGKPEDDLAPLRDAGIEVVESGSTVELAAALQVLGARGWSRLLCEGGPGLHRDLLAAGLVDELSLTLAPVAVGGQGMRSTSGDALDPPRSFDPTFVLGGEDGTLFTSYRSRD
ncbi:dihydrofolate reductase family protein [uncultured Friedmanniella sp.]|uniref:dihydrofolate reductase family protein n=1 Tax=uncultured Friedmanniella sp. TaxID=335381 RepID=UPI0035CBAAA1